MNNINVHTAAEEDWWDNNQSNGVALEPNPNP
jgi:hypothetical protein